MRLFVAVYPPEYALDHFAAAVDGLRLGAATAAGTNVRLAARPLWHITMAFLGELADDRAPAAEAALQAGAARWRDQAGEPTATAPRLRLAGGGRFGRRRFTVVWVGLAGDLDAFGGLALALRRELRRARLPFDRKQLRPHLTFARPGDRLPPADVAADVDALRQYEGPEWPVDEVHLVRSTLGPRPVHEVLARAPLLPPPA